MNDSSFPKTEKSVQQYQKEIMEAQLKIRQLQDKCLHPSFEVHMYMWRPGAMHPQRICTTCDALIPGVTKEEEDFAWNEWRKMGEAASGVVSTVESATVSNTITSLKTEKEK